LGGFFSRGFNFGIGNGSRTVVDSVIDQPSPRLTRYVTVAAGRRSLGAMVAGPTGCATCGAIRRDQSLDTTVDGGAVPDRIRLNSVAPLGQEPAMEKHLCNGAAEMRDVKLFIGSSGATAEVSGLIANRLETLGCGKVRVWDEGEFTLNHSVLERLLDIISEYDFAVMVWGPDDVTESKGDSQASPRDNVIFECGLFMGKLGRDRVFIVCDKNVKIKIPSDFAGITLAYYDGSRIEEDGVSAIRSACDQIAAQIRKPRLQEFVGEWRSRYLKTAEIGHAEVIDDVDVDSSHDGIIITSKPAPKTASYQAKGQIHNNQIIGKWRHLPGESFAEGVFLLVVDPMARVMYGYCTGRNETGAMVFDTWVFVKKRGLTEVELNERLFWGEKELLEHTQRLPLPDLKRPGGARSHPR
jgi:predicted nucleotide-binding protein